MIPTLPLLAGRVAWALDLGQVLTVPLLQGTLTAEWRCKAHELRYDDQQNTLRSDVPVCLNGCAPLYANKPTGKRETFGEHRRGTYRIEYRPKTGKDFWTGVYEDADKCAAEVLAQCGQRAVYAVLGDVVPR